MVGGITTGDNMLGQSLFFILSMSMIGLILYIVKRDYDAQEKDTAAGNMLSNLASITELRTRLRDKIVDEDDDVKEKLEFAIDEITEYGDELFYFFISII